MANNKYNTEIVREMFLESGLIIEEGWEYTNDGSNNITFVCESNHKSLRSFSSVKNNRYCKKCKKEKDIKEIASKKGFTIDPNWQHIDSKEKIPFTCSNGHKSSKTLACFKSSNCFECIYSIGLYSTKTVIDNFNNKGFYICNNSWKYEGPNCKIKFICSNGHKMEMTAYSVITEDRACIFCNSKNIVNTESIRKEFLKEGLRIDEGWEFKGINKSIPFKCSKGHSGEKAYSYFSKRQECSTCSKDRDILHNSHDTKTKIAEMGFKLINKNWQYRNAIERIDVICKRGHKISVKHYYIKKGIKCSQCVRRSPIMPDAPALVYFLRFKNLENKDYLKVGITTRSVEERFYNDTRVGFEMEVIRIHKTTWEKAFSIETSLKRHLKEQRIYGRYDFSINGGGTECFDLEHLKKASEAWENLTS